MFIPFASASHFALAILMALASLSLTRFAIFKLSPPMPPLQPGQMRWGEMLLYFLCFAGIVWMGTVLPDKELLPTCILIVFCWISTVIDIRHRIIPDQLTLPGIVVGLILGAVLPSFVGAKSWQQGVLDSFLGAVVGAGFIAIIVEFGKLAFGKLVKVLTPPEVFEFKHEEGGEHKVVVDGEELEWSSLFNRKSDRLILDCTELKVGWPEKTGKQLKIGWNTYQMDDEGVVEISSKTSFSGIVHRIVIPREAMGYGDAQFMAVVGAFIGWHGAVLTICAGAAIGSVIGIGMKMAGKGNTLPFVPFLAGGVLVWFFAGEKIISTVFAR